MSRILALFLSLLVASPALADITANGQVKKAQFEKLSSDPTCAAARYYYNTTSHTGKLCHNSTWYSLVPNLMDSSGDLLMGGASGVVTKLDHPGSANRLLRTSTTSAIAWGQLADGDIPSATISHTKLANITAGSVLLGNASAVPTATALSGDVTVNSSGVTAIGTGVIVNADVNSGAEIAGSKIDPDFDDVITTTGSSVVVNSPGDAWIELDAVTGEDSLVVLREDNVSEWTLIHDSSDGSKFEIHNNTPAEVFSITQAGTTDVIALTTTAADNSATTRPWSISNSAGSQIATYGAYSLNGTTGYDIYVGGSKVVDVGASTVAITGGLSVSATTGGNVYAGAYTPTPSSLTNLDSAGSCRGSYLRVMDTVHVTLYCSVDPTAASTVTSFNLPLPVATSNFSSSTQAQGTVTVERQASALSASGVVFSNSGAQTAHLRFMVGSNTSAYNLGASFNYEIQ